jgi:hypothetical protein
MGCSIKFVRLDDFIADIDELDLSANGYSLADNGYFPVVAPIGAKSVNESITLKLQGTSKDDLAEMVQLIDEKIKQVQWWIDDPGVERYQVWIRVQQEGETYARQAQILNIKPPDKVQLFTPMEINGNYIGNYQIGIERTPFWEDPYPYEFDWATISGLNSVGNKASLGIKNGDVPARIPKLKISGGFSASFSTFWIGFKTNRLGIASNLQTAWCLDLSVYLSYDTTVTVDATAYDGNRLTCTFGTPTLLNRVTAYLMDMVSNPDYYQDQRGTYLVLLRAKMSTTGTARVRMASGFPGYEKYSSRQVISGTSWQLYELGEIQIPSIKIPDNYYSLRRYHISLEAELISGSPDLHLDCLILIPSFEGMIKVSSTSVGASNSIVISQNADGSIVTYAATNTGEEIIALAVHSEKRWGLPTDDTDVIMVAAANSNVINTISSNYAYIPRWRTLRGDQTGSGGT